jgi:hypothetical protein
MVDMKMGAQNIVNLLWTNTRILQLLQKGAIIAVLPVREVFACFVVTDATVYKNCVMRGTNQITLNGKNQPAGCRGYQLGHEPMKVGLECFFGAIGKPFGGRLQRVAHLQNSRNPDIPNSPVIHANRPPSIWH